MVPGAVGLSMRRTLVDPYAAFGIPAEGELSIEDEQQIVETERIANPIEAHDVKLPEERSVPALCDNLKMSPSSAASLRTASMTVCCARLTGGMPTACRRACRAASLHPWI